MTNNNGQIFLVQQITYGKPTYFWVSMTRLLSKGSITRLLCDVANSILTYHGYVDPGTMHHDWVLKSHGKSGNLVLALRYGFVQVP